ncbi:MAG: hypothetical protein KAX44_02490 [Candidatus Brocadiae bacterium]|nr:hypothetical protein [Candidatus Brocadiia bacterium]
MAELLLGIDVGTSGVKAGVFDAEGRLLGLGRSSHSVDSPHPGWVQCDPALWWRGILKSVAGACGEARVAGRDIAAVGVDVLFPTIVPMAADGRAVHPAILYCDQRSIAQVRAIEETVGRGEYQRITGNMLVPGNCAATSIAWLRDEQPKAYAAADTIGFANTFVTSRLTGDFFTDPSMVAVSGLVDIGDPWQWSEDMCDRLGIDPRRLPKIAGAAQVVGTVTVDAAEQTGLAAGTPVVCGAGDVPVCAVGAGALSPNTVTYVAGSTDCASLAMSRPTTDLRWVNTAYVPRGTWFGIGTTSASGVSIEWFIREFLGERGPAGLRMVTELAASSPPGANGVLFLPYLQGERTPVWDPMARGLFIGLTSRTTRADLARAVFEGTSFALRQVMECTDTVAGHAVKEIRAVGGGTRNDLWNQIKADVLQQPLDVLEFQETGTLGGALLAGVGTGVYGSFEDAIAVARSAGGARTVEPDSSRAALYDELFDLYERTYPQIRDIAHGLGGNA